MGAMMSGNEQTIPSDTTDETVQGEPANMLEKGPTIEDLQKALASMQQELEKKSSEAAEYLDNWRRSAAELSNARKRMLREQEEARATAAQRVLEKLLPVLDDLDRAFTVLAENEADSEWVSGFRAIQRKLQVLLESEGVVPIGLTVRCSIRCCTMPLPTKRPTGTSRDKSSEKPHMVTCCTTRSCGPAWCGWQKEIMRETRKVI
jgi:molecular chaperone GrpE